MLLGEKKYFLKAENIPTNAGGEIEAYYYFNEIELLQSKGSVGERNVYKEHALRKRHRLETRGSPTALTATTILKKHGVKTVLGEQELAI